MLVLSDFDVKSMAESLDSEQFQMFQDMLSVALTTKTPFDGGLQPQRMVLQFPEMTGLVMPASLAAEPTSKGDEKKVISYGMKHVTVTAQGAVAGYVTVTHPMNGHLVCIANAKTLTGFRTALSSSLAISLYANPETESLIVFGSGLQAYWHVQLAARCLPKLANVYIWNRSDNDRLKFLIQDLESTLPAITFTPAVTQNLSDILPKMQVILSCAPFDVPLYVSDSVAQGTLLVLIGGYTYDMHEVGPDIIERALKDGPILVDDAASCLAESGELHSASVQADQLKGIGEAFKDFYASESITHFYNPDVIKVYKGVGTGVMDVEVARAFFNLARMNGGGQNVEF
ncbi:hypothetical protein CANCADRAFT_1938 [Tortispora caseinolytica NRRL Y-17796]|uniref:Ornithine cyclodeaminase n=1 Tax=Tortispora caseinolytica NRRL Y-17796 TaxID=767744 RepID=A0A1E4TEQ4_9ASCO|nr:hypothetical protein CANCADRAFT_1938 [Tortispora caseinolytica NRRL Y-17796]